MVYLNILLISAVICMIIDLSGVTDEIKCILKRWLGIKNIADRPFFCSLCLTHWTGIVYILYLYMQGCDYNYILLYCYVLFISLNTINIANFIQLIIDIINNIINRLWRF